MEETKVKKPIYKRWWFIVIVVLLVLGIIGSIFGDDSDKNANQPKEKTQTEQKADEKKAAPAEEKKEEPKVPAEYKAALKSAESYSEIMHMSKQGIYDQLISDAGDKFPPEAAQYAIDNLKADYKKNALESAKNYRDTMNMSNEEIRDQLSSEYGENFTQEEADYAVENLPQ